MKSKSDPIDGSDSYVTPFYKDIYQAIKEVLSKIRQLKFYVKS